MEIVGRLDLRLESHVPCICHMCLQSRSFPLNIVHQDIIVDLMVFNSGLADLGGCQERVGILLSAIFT